MQSPWFQEPVETLDLWIRCWECKHHEIVQHGVPGKRAWKKVPKCLRFHVYRPWTMNACTSFEQKT